MKTYFSTRARIKGGALKNVNKKMVVGGGGGKGIQRRA